MPVLPSPRPALDPDGWELEVARLDRSGRLFARRLLAALSWPTGQGGDIDDQAGAIVVTTTMTQRSVASPARTATVLPAPTLAGDDAEPCSPRTS
jgi:hypothetical protein